VFTRIFPWSQSWARSIQSIPAHPISEIHPNKPQPKSKSSYELFPSVLSQKNPVCILLIPYAYYMTCLSHPPWLDYSNYIWRSVQLMKLLVIQLSQPPVTSGLLGPTILLNTLFSNTVSRGSSLNVRNQASYTYRTTGKIIVLYILVFTFLGSRQSNGIKHYPNSVSS
jgi:hypothetical protein